MSTDQVEQLRVEVKGLKTCLQSLVFLLDKKEVIKSEEWAAMNLEVYEILREHHNRQRLNHSFRESDQ